ncbi:hypothetical protein CPELA_10125 [Corynebacterium pelargi]|uniref:Uncharacterized protein n=1 Tax=Corynebacterium pelargi TaxID=1471400 RepID=A0A410WBG0_9CORY|nr:hypothetical protein CPELA_10125 [Corynebacterium pelargi]
MVPLEPISSSKSLTAFSRGAVSLSDFLGNVSGIISRVAEGFENPIIILLLALKISQRPLHIIYLATNSPTQRYCEFGCL